MKPRIFADTHIVTIARPWLGRIRWEVGIAVIRWRPIGAPALVNDVIIEPTSATEDMNETGTYLQLVLRNNILTCFSKLKMHS